MPVLARPSPAELINEVISSLCFVLMPGKLALLLRLCNRKQP